VSTTGHDQDTEKMGVSQAEAFSWWTMARWECQLWKSSFLGCNGMTTGQQLSTNMAPFPKTHQKKISENLKSHSANFEIKQLLLFWRKWIKKFTYLRNYL